MADRVVDIVGQEKRRVETGEPPPNPKRRRTGTGEVEVAVKSPEVHRDSGVSAGSRDSGFTDMCGNPRRRVSTGIYSNPSADRVGQVHEASGSPAGFSAGSHDTDGSPAGSSAGSPDTDGSTAGSSAGSPDTDGSPSCGSLPGTSGNPQLHGSTGISPCTEVSLQVYTTADFEALYENLRPLGEGGYGTVYSGKRKEDNLLVAIKYIPMAKVHIVPINLSGQLITIPLEVALMLQAVDATAAKHPGAVVGLLDWFQLDQNLVLILERPVPCIDLFTYAARKGGALKEQSAKVCGGGTRLYIPPEWFLRRSYLAEPLTVWQVGVLLYELLAGQYAFQTTDEIVKDKPPHIPHGISSNCKDFLRQCLSKEPLERPTLRSLMLHSWLQ
ncbi:hypothetical protein CRUP_005048 [Coryphaenoides rupestris]|nr:hypothetical protein CRUP_005048 [Coryphaenoides rupestris]